MLCLPFSHVKHVLQMRILDKVLLGTSLMLDELTTDFPMTLDPPLLMSYSSSLLPTSTCCGGSPINP